MARKRRYTNSLKFARRDRIIRELGFKTYRAYLDSDLWKSIRSRMLVCGTKCSLCARADATQVHHSKYTHGNLSGDSLKGLYPTCGPCHRYIEIGKRGGHRPPASVNRRFQRRLKSVRNINRFGTNFKKSKVIRLDQPVTREQVLGLSPIFVHEPDGSRR